MGQVAFLEAWDIVKIEFDAANRRVCGAENQAEKVSKALSRATAH